MITVDGLTVEFGGTTLFKDISFQINEKDRIALMGKNGAGKSTLLFCKTLVPKITVKLLSYFCKINKRTSKYEKKREIRA